MESLNKSLYPFYEERGITALPVQEALQRANWVKSCTSVPNTPVSGTTKGSKVARNRLAKAAAFCPASQKRLDAMSIIFFTSLVLANISWGSAKGTAWIHPAKLL